MECEETSWLVMLDGSIVWQPTEDDYALWRDELQDLAMEDDE